MAEDLTKMNSALEDEAEEYTLESILAEYKGNAYIAGERKLSKESLESQAAKIIDEMKREIADPKAAIPTVAVEEDEVTEYRPPEKKPLDKPETPAFAMERQPAETKKGRREKRSETPGFISRDAGDAAKPIKTGGRRQKRELDEKSMRESVLEAARIERLERERQEAERRSAELTMTEEEQMFFGVGKYARPEVVEDVAEEVEETISAKAEKKRRQRHKEKLVEMVEEAAETEEKELSPEEAENIYGSGVRSLRRRILIVLLLAVLSLLCALGEKYSVDFVLLNRPQSAALMQLALLMLSLLMGLDVFLCGITNLFKGRAGGDTLASAAALASIADAVYIMISGRVELGQPYCTAAIFALLCAMWGTRLSKTAYKTTFRTMRAAQLPTIVTAEWERADEGLVLTKKLGSAQGFVSKSLECDFSENLFKRLAPMLILASLVFALITSVFRGEAQNFLHCFAGLTAASSAASALIVYNMPFCETARKLAGSGAALAGWNGARDVNDAIGLVVKDADLFPENTLSLGGVKSFANRPVESVISYTSSLIIASGSGLTRIFGDLLKEYACSIYRVDEFSCYEGGGVGAMINGDRVLVGSAAFMNLMGVRLAPNLNLRTAVFTAINDELAGVFIINYTPVDMVQNALVSLVRSKIRPLFAVRDFNITPAMIKNKFKISTEQIEFLSFEARYKLSADTETPEIRPSAVMSREGLSHFVEIARRGRELVSKVRYGSIITAVGAILGLVIMFVICASSSFSAGSAANVTTFLALWTTAVILLNQT